MGSKNLISTLESEVVYMNSQELWLDAPRPAYDQHSQNICMNYQWTHKVLLLSEKLLAIGGC